MIGLSLLLSLFRLTTKVSSEAEPVIIIFE
jgi:hypothetical protein